MFATEVMPRLRSRFSEWEDNWFPRDRPAQAPAPISQRAPALAPSEAAE
jgi:hypothetical protein